MASGSNIEWTDCTWNPVSGCTRVSAGCDNCYAVPMTNRLEAMGQAKYAGLTVLNGKGDRHFNGVVRCHDDALEVPLRWRKPRRIFVNSMSDLFHRDVPFEFVDKVFAVMALCPQHTFQVLTKRPERMAEYLADLARRVQEWNGGEGEPEEYLIQRLCDETDQVEVAEPCHRWLNTYNARNLGWPLPNVWLGTSIENQDAADKRIPHLLKCSAAVRFLSAEPLLGPLDLSAFFGGEYATATGSEPNYNFGISWCIVGGESGHGARPMDIEWARSIRDQCQAAGVPFFMKQMVVNGKVTGELLKFPEDLRVREFPSTLQTAK